MRSKYGAIKTKVNKITFDSKAEARYYLVLLNKKNNKEIVDFELQPKFLLQEKFQKRGKKFAAINYIADFKVIHNDGSVEIIDVKGVETETFRVKRKLFEFKYPELSLTIIKGDAIDAKIKLPKQEKETKQATTREKKTRTRNNLAKRL